MVKTICASLAICTADSPTCAPAACSSFMASAFRSKTFRLWPALSRFSAMGLPIWPSPINAIVLLILSPRHYENGAVRRRSGLPGSQVSQGMSRFCGPGRNKKAFHPAGISLFQRRRIPAWLFILINQQCAYAFLEVALYATLQRHNVFQTENIGQRQVVDPLQQLKGQASRTRSAFSEGLRGAGQPGVGTILPLLQSLCNAFKFAAGADITQHGVILLQRAAIGASALCQTAQDLMQAAVTSGAFIRPARGLQGLEQGVEMHPWQVSVRQAQEQAVRGVDLRAAQRQEVADARRQVR